MTWCTSLATPYSTQAYAEAILALVGRLAPEVVVVFDPSPLVASIDRVALEVVFARVDWLSCNAREAQVLTEASGPE